MPYTFLSQRNDLGGGPVSLIRDSIIRFFPQNRAGSLNGSLSCATRSTQNVLATSEVYRDINGGCIHEVWLSYYNY